MYKEYNRVDRPLINPGFTIREYNMGRMKREVDYLNDLDEQDDARDLNDMTADDDASILESIKE